ncbi:MAG: serine/threonine protein kinase [Candidatus Riflebacteria bacterium]|nr:serine/threonine protein kinase [Candidatus Riflebacteria bacterium]
MCPATSFLELTDSEFRASYRIGSRIGAGGLGEVFLATQISLDRKVVVKLLRREVTSDRTNLLRFEREALILSRLSHPRLVRVYEYGLWNGKPFMIQEYLEGGSLADLLGKTRRLDIEETIQFGRQVGEGLQFLHEKGILHRDIKPANILLTRSREAKIGDFGLVRQEGD